MEYSEFPPGLRATEIARIAGATAQRAELGCQQAGECTAILSSPDIISFKAKY